MQDSNFKKRMEDLAKKKKEEQDQRIDPKELLKKRNEIEANSKKVFNNLKREVILPTRKELNEIFKATGAYFHAFSNEEATALKDSIRTFCQLFYYPKERGMQKVGLNTASILFECLPYREEVKISMNPHIRPAPLKLLYTIPLEEFTKEKIEDYISEFVSEATKETTG